MNEEEAETRGYAIAAYALSHGMLALLTAKGVIDEQASVELLDGILAGLENILPANDPGIQTARVLVETILQVQAEVRRKRQQGNR